MRAIAWDMDGTLVNTEPLWSIATYGMAEQMGRPLTVAQRAETVGGTAQHTVEYCLKNAGQEPTPNLVEEWLEWFFQEMSTIFANGIEFRPGFPRLLGECAAAGYPQVLVTNTARRLVDYCLPAIGEDYFVGSVAGDEVPRGKPHPDGYSRACDLMGVDPDEVLVIEDSATGMSAARAAGCRVLGVPCEPGVSAPTGVMTLSDLHHGTTDLAELTAPDLAEIWDQLGQR